MSRLQGVKGSGKQYSAKCPAHNDKCASLSVSAGGDGRILLFCHAGCTPRDVLAALHLEESDLFRDPKKTEKIQDSRTQEAEYIYTDRSGRPILKKVKYRLSTGSKSFSWFHLRSGRWEKGTGALDVPLYNQAVLSTTDTVYIVEGEKDVETMKRLGLPAVSSPSGAGAKWKTAHTGLFKGLHVVILQDNDEPGKKAAQGVATALNGTAADIRVVDLTQEWPELPEKGDISDVQGCAAEIRDRLDALVLMTPEWTEEDDFFSLFKTLEDFEEEDAAWVIDGWIPEGQITLMAADGGTGKTSTWCNVIAALSCGGECIFDSGPVRRAPAKVAFLTTEDSIRKKLKKKLREAGANLGNIISPDFSADKTGELRDLKFGSEKMERFVRKVRPALCIFDPVQGFIPPEINMGSRNAMRDCMAPLIALGEECGTTFLVVCHTNKRKGAYGRDRIADSADLWDISRSVIMIGYTEEQGVRYMSNEKNNYEQLQDTILFSINDKGQPEREGTTWKRDREFMADAQLSVSSPKREDCKAAIVKRLESSFGRMRVSDLEEELKEAGYSFRTIRRAKDELKESGEIRLSKAGSCKTKDQFWSIELAAETLQENDEKSLSPSDT